MKQIFTLIALLGTSYLAIAQAEALAERLGVCGAGQSTDPFSVSCQQCQLTFVSLSPGQAEDELFFLEARSAVHCGTGGCTGTIYQKRGNSYRELAFVFGQFERAISRPGQPPYLIYEHDESPRRDYDRDGRQDPAVLRVKYRWDSRQQRIVMVDLLSVTVNGQSIPVAPWREVLLREWKMGSPWVN